MDVGDTRRALEVNVLRRTPLHGVQAARELPFELVWRISDQ